MENMEEILGKSVLLLGYGREGMSVHRHLLSKHPDKKVGIADQREVTPINNLTAELTTGEEYLSSLCHYDVIVRSPGVSLQLLELKKCLALGKKLTSATNIFFSECLGTIIGVTGTKGKSTASSLITSILKQKYKDVRLVGNIGRPALDYLPDSNEKTMFVMELSSFQLEDIRYSPHAVCLLSIVPEHLDRYGSFSHYLSAKSRILKYQQPQDIVIFNSSCPNIQKLILGSPAKKYSFSLRSKGASCYFNGRDIFVQGEEGRPCFIMRRSEIPLFGEGNVENTLAAILAGVCVLLFFQLGYLLGGLRCGLLAAFFLLLNPIFRSMQVRLMLEIPVLLFALASLYFLARWEKDLRNGDFSWVRLAWFSLFAGFSISSKLYGFSLYLAFLLVFMLNVKKLSSRAWGSLGLVVGVGLFIFIFSNPLLLHDPLFALKSMTVAHVAGEDGGSITRWSLSSLKYMLTYPFLFARAGTFDLDTVFRPPVYGQDVIFLFFGYLLAVLGVIGAFKRGLVVPFAFLFGAVLMQGYVVSTHGEGWMMPRVLFFPAVAVAWFYCFIDWSSIIGFFRRGPKSQDEPVSKERILSDE